MRFRYQLRGLLFVETQVDGTVADVATCGNAAVRMNRPEAEPPAQPGRHRRAYRFVPLPVSILLPLMSCPAATPPCVAVTLGAGGLFSFRFERLNFTTAQTPPATTTAPLPTQASTVRLFSSRRKDQILSNMTLAPFPVILYTTVPSSCRVRPARNPYLGLLGELGGGVTLSSRTLTNADCRCISVLPTGDLDWEGRLAYRVINSCDGLEVSVQFTGDILRLSPHPSAFSSWAQAGLLGNNQERMVRAPAW